MQINIWIGQKNTHQILKFAAKFFDRRKSKIKYLVKCEILFYTVLENFMGNIKKM